MTNKATPSFVNRCEIIYTVKSSDIQQILKNLGDLKYWAYILHEKEKNAPHYHIYLDFGEKFVDKSYIAELFDVEERKVYEVTASREQILVYLKQAAKKGEYVCKMI